MRAAEIERRLSAVAQDGDVRCDGGMIEQPAGGQVFLPVDHGMEPSLVAALVPLLLL
jgi:hypothetical protein